jgi:class 3 adenylate cyclase
MCADMGTGMSSVPIRVASLDSARTMVSRPKTRYARSGDVNIAYQVAGDGPLDLVYVPGWISNVETAWEDPDVRAFLERLASFSRLVLFDKRGTGLSDRVPIDGLPTVEQRMDDVRAVMDAAGIEQAALLGMSEGGPMCALFAATHPERCSGLVIYGSYANARNPGMLDPETADVVAEELLDVWDDAGGLLYLWAPTAAENEQAREAFGRYLRSGASPASAAALVQMNVALDVSDALPVIDVPTMVLHRTDDMIIPLEAGREMAQEINGARFVELDGVDHLWFHGDREALLGEIEEFLTGVRTRPDPQRALATVMFTDIVGSTERAVQMGDGEWRTLVERHDNLVREHVEHYKGKTIKTLGDGVLATFDGPAKGIRCAQTLTRAVRELGIEIRAGLHTGECELIGDDVGGIAVNIGARVGALAGAGEVLVSRTVTDLVAGSGLEFEDHGSHELKGVPGRWQLYAVR